MASTVRVAAVSLLLLLVCGSLHPQASAVTPPSFLESLSLFCGRFGSREFNGQKLKDRIPIQKPLDIPSLNQYFPVHNTEIADGELDVETLSLFIMNSHGNYVLTSHNLVNISIARNPDLDVSKITLDDVDSNIRCQEEFIQLGVPTVTRVECFHTPEYAGWVFEYIYTCEYVNATTVAVPDGQNMWQGYLTIWKQEQFPLPYSWLEGNECYEDPCSI